MLFVQADRQGYLQSSPGQGPPLSSTVLQCGPDPCQNEPGAATGCSLRTTRNSLNISMGLDHSLAHPNDSMSHLGDGYTSQLPNSDLKECHDHVTKSDTKSTLACQADG